MRALRPLDALGALIFIAAWSASAAYLVSKGMGLEDVATFLVAFAIILPIVAYVLTIGANAPSIEVKRPKLEAGAVLIYLALYAFLFLGIGMSWARSVVPAGREQELIVVGLKLLVHVLVPALLLLALGAKLGPLTQLGLSGRKFWRTLVVMAVLLLGLQCVVSPSLQHIENMHASPTTLAMVGSAFFLWIAIEAGLCEEFFFRAVLQTRLIALFNAPVLGIVLASLLFALAHVPGLWLRGGEEVSGSSHDVMQVIAYAIAILSPLAICFGTVYARTKSLLLVILLHACVDFLPGLPDFADIWFS